MSSTTYPLSHNPDNFQHSTWGNIRILTNHFTYIGCYLSIRGSCSFWIIQKIFHKLRQVIYLCCDICNHGRVDSTMIHFQIMYPNLNTIQTVLSFFD